MTDAVKARAFEPFFTTKDAGKGTGLGLSMVFGFAALIAGTVTIDSEPGRGTTINLYIPCATAGAAIVAGLPASENAPDALAGIPNGLRVMVIDDDDSVRTTAQVMLEGLGAEVVAVESGRSALAVLKTDRRFDLLIIDFAMPLMNGSEVATEIDTFWPDAPVLFVTGYVENDVLRPWRERGIPTLNKPYAQSELVAAIERALHVAAAAAPAVSERA